MSRMRGLGVVILIFAAGCGLHLGDNYGRRTKAALEAQANSPAAGVPISADDAKNVMAKHNGRSGQQSGAGSGGSYSSSMSSGYSDSGSSSAAQPILITPAPASPIRLDAVR